MSASYKVLKPNDIEQLDENYRQFALDVLLGLSETPKKLDCMYIYDDAGSAIFQEITDLGEYYPTECEREIFELHKKQIGEMVGGEPFNLVELGAGDGRKTNVLLDDFLKTNQDFHYVPIDISEDAIKGLMGNMNRLFPDLSVQGLVSEYFDGLKWLSKMNHRRNVVLFLGSNVGNFGFSKARVFLKSLWNALNPGDYVLIGFDLKKDIDLLLKAYNDSEGVTARFNLNLLERINSELGGHFDLKKFRHFGTYDVFSGAMESYLISLEQQTIYIDQLQQNFYFNAWEPIHIESSYKYLDADIAHLAHETSFTIEKQFYDSREYFTDSLWKVSKVTK